MRREFLTSFVLASVISFSFGCEDQGTSSVIERDELARPFTSGTYFTYGAINAEALLEKIRAEGLSIREAWLPNFDGPCLRLELPQLVVGLAEPDQAILEFGFNKDSSAAIGSCTSTWKHYRY